ncbi:MAG: hypothetical protein HC802_11090 [Caldilineaceae bacterium]|nr:hypothetical protein [Caldilineaceae bacterium]
MRILSGWLLLTLSLLLLMIGSTGSAIASNPALGIDPLSLPQTTQDVFALPGMLREVSGLPYSHALLLTDGSIAGLYGQTPDVESQISALAAVGADTPVKVWGRFSSVRRTVRWPRDPGLRDPGGWRRGGRTDFGPARRANRGFGSGGRGSLRLCQRARRSGHRV